MPMLFETLNLERCLNVCTLRQQVTANNIANINSPGYRGKKVLFETELREAMDSGGAAEPRVVEQTGRLDINNEMCTSSKNQIMYHALCQRISGIFGSLKWVIENAAR